VSWEDLRSTYVSMLTEEGFRPEIDSYGDIHFKFEGGNYYITNNCDDTYFYLLYPSFWSISGDAELSRAMRAANAATRTTKAAKVYVHPDGSDVSATLEVLVASPADVRAFLARGFRCIRSAVNSFIEEMNKQN